MMMYDELIVMLTSGLRRCSMSTTIDDCAVSLCRDSADKACGVWAPFKKRLTSVLSQLEKDQYLIISAKGLNRFVQFACQGEEGMRVEVTSNHFLKGRDRLNRRQISWLRAHGWNAPTGSQKQATPEKDPNGSPNYFVDLPAPLATEDIAHLAVDALVNGLEIPSPASLAYEAFDKSGKNIRIEELDLTPVIADNRGPMERLLEVFRHVTGIADLELDKDGDISISRGGVHIWATQVESRVRMFAALVHDMAETPAILRRLNELNKGSHGFRCALNQGTIYASFDILANPFIPEHFELGIEEFAGTAVRIASLLRNEFSWGFFTETGRTPHVIQ
jgi:hypothetical protein